jgi:hypothetical protein
MEKNTKRRKNWHGNHLKQSLSFLIQKQWLSGPSGSLL